MPPPNNLHDDLKALTLDPEDPEAGKKRSLRSYAIIGSAVLVALVALFFAVRAFKSGPESVRLAEATPKSRWASAIALIATGHIEPEKRVFVTSPIGGRIKKINVTAGQAVAKGDVVAELDPAFLEASLAEQKAALGSAKAKLKAAKRKVAMERAKAKKDKNADADASQRAIGVAAANASAAQAEQRAVEAKLAALKLVLSNAKVRAPMTGRVARIIASEGQSLSEGSLEIAEIVDTSVLFVDADVAESKLGLLSTGMPADVTLDAFPDRHFDARILEIKPEVDKQTSTAAVRLRLTNPSSDVLLSMAARVSFLTRPIDPAQRSAEAKLTVPADAVTERGGKKVVFVYRGGAVEETGVLIGETVGPDIEILGGLKAQERVIVSPPPDLATGDKVEVRR